MTIKMFVLGDPGAGKSTLVKSIETESEGVASRLKNQVSKVRDVDKKTAGIIPHEINSKTLGRVTVYDFAGHREFYAGHDAVLRNSSGNSPSVILLVTDMRGEQKKIQETVEYWLEFLAQQNYEESCKPHLIIIGSHVDEISKDDAKSKSIFLQSLVSSHNMDSYLHTDQVMLDCRYAERSSMSKLRRMLSQICQKLRSPEKLDFASHCLLVFLLDKFREESAVTLTMVSHALQKAVAHEVHWKFMVTLDLDSLCSELNKQGSILYMKGHENSWIVLDKAVLLSQVQGKLFAPEDFKQHQNVATNTGVVPLSKLSSLFPELNSKMFSQFLCHLEFCQEITDNDVLSLLESDAALSPSTAERFFYFPALVHLQMPPGLWVQCSNFNYHSGWLLKCFKHEQFFTTRFLQVLFLRLAFKFALVPTDIAITSMQHPALQRKCSVWKNGITWVNQSGVEALVEVIEQKQIIVLVRSKLEKLKSVELLSAIIQTVLVAQNEFCCKVLVSESLIFPKDARAYPLDLTQVATVNMTDVAQTVKAGEKFVVLNNNQSLLLDKLLHFEAYASMNEDILQELFSEHNPKHYTQIQPEFMERFSECMHGQVGDIIAVFKLSYKELDVIRTLSDYHKVVELLQLWKKKNEVNGTYCNLHKMLDQFSVFAGRNPLKVAKGMACVLYILTKQ